MTYAGFAAAWPTLTGTGEFGERMNNLPKYVVSTTLDTAAWNNSRLIKDNVVAEIARLREQPDQTILVAGSADLVHTLMQHGLVDEYRLMVHPVVVGRGKRLFREGHAQTALRLVDTRPLRSGIVILTYHPAPPE